MNVYRKSQSIFCYVVDVNIISICLLSVILIYFDIARFLCNSSASCYPQFRRSMPS